MTGKVFVDDKRCGADCIHGYRDLVRLRGECWAGFPATYRGGRLNVPDREREKLPMLMRKLHRIELIRLFIASIGMLAILAPDIYIFCDDR